MAQDAVGVGRMFIGITVFQRGDMMVVIILTPEFIRVASGCPIASSSLQRMPS